MRCWSGWVGGWVDLLFHGSVVGLQVEDNLLEGLVVLLLLGESDLGGWVGE